jgi:cysteinyl-tRNA synthetase
VITARYERFYLGDMGALGVAPASLAPKATETVAEMIAMIARLIETGHAYERTATFFSTCRRIRITGR